ncbi:DinB family protein [Spirosoma soli]|uniref:DinB family protein n=1 Tax=Spirosoma soli TaxID=1770529 RepID=A0ABW5MF29_9BACT
MKQSLLNRLAGQPDALTHLLYGLSEEQIYQRLSNDKWSIFENLAHLGRYQEVFLDRMQHINADEAPTFSRYVADDDPGFPDWTRLSFEELTERMRGERAALNAFISIMHEEQLMRIGLHPVYGPMTLLGWTEFFLLHEAHHFLTILKLGGSLRTADRPMGLPAIQPL